MPRRRTPPPLPGARRPRRFLVVVGCVFAAAAAAVLMGWATLRRTYDEHVAPTITAGGLARAWQAVEAERTKVGRRLTDAEADVLIEGIHDAWGRQLRYSVLDDENYGQGVYYKIVTAGADGVFGTSDDDCIVWN